MSNSAQKRAIENYRSRLTARGIVRFELQAFETDRDLIRTLARKLIEEARKPGISDGRCNKLSPASPPSPVVF